MMYFYIILISILLIGIIRIIVQITSNNENWAFIAEYREKLVKLANRRFSKQNANDETDYGEIFIWLTKNSDRAQASLGRAGIIEYIGPFNRYHHRNYHLVVNTIAKFSTGDLHDNDVAYCDNALLRQYGEHEEVRRSLIKQLKNPFIWLREGVRMVFSMPIYVLEWCGFISEPKTRRIVESKFMSIFTGINTFIGITSGLVTIVIGKESISNIWSFITNLLK